MIDPKNAPERKERRYSQKKDQDRPLWAEILWLIPKNLVYVFVIVIVFAFAAMMYITYTDRNMTEFLTYDRTKEIVVVDPLFTALRDYMQIKPNQKVPEVQASTFNVKIFNSAFLRKNQPVKVLGMAAEWNATKKWDSAYLFDIAGDSSLLYSQLVKKSGSLDKPWSFAV